jgi:hypothetical protein
MTDDHDEALKAVYLAQTEGEHEGYSQAFLQGGQLFHFAKSGTECRRHVIGGQ